MVSLAIQRCELFVTMMNNMKLINYQLIRIAVATIGIILITLPSSVSAAKLQCIGPDGKLKEITSTRPAGETCADHGLKDYVDNGSAQTDGDGNGNANGGTCGVDTVILGCSGSGPNPIIRTFMEIFEFFAVGVGILVVGGIIFGGIRYATANGNTSQAEQGVSIIVNAIIGLLLFIFMFVLVNWLVPGGIFA